MLFSLNFLKQLANLPKSLSDETILEAINELGFEVENTHVMPKIKGVKFGKILMTEKNPQGDKLTICKIQFHDQTRTIQTTDQTVKANDIIIAFVPGSSKDELTFSAKTLKGTISEGMLTSSSELGINQTLMFPDNPTGLNTYPDLYDLTLDPVKILNLNDTIIDITILPNRVDANSYYVMARELSAYFKLKPFKFNPKKPQFKTNVSFKTSPNTLGTLIEARNLSPLTWSEKTLLVKSNLAITNTPSDWGNLTFIMTGQPVETFNLELIKAPLSLTTSSETTIVLNHQTLTLNQHLVIKDSQQILSLSGIGTIDTFKPQQHQTSALFIFSQVPNVKVRDNIKLSKVNPSLQTIQMMRLNNPNLIHLAIDYLTANVNQISFPVNLKPLQKPTPIKYLNSMIDSIAGFNLTTNAKFNQTIISLKTLGFTISKNTLTPPLYRNDINTFQDICEEIFRFYNYNNFPLIAPSLITNQVVWPINLPLILVNQGFNQVLTYALTSETKNTFNPFNFSEPIKLLTPYSLLRSQFRNSLLISFQEIITHHLKQKILPLNIFEIGQIHNSTNVLAIATSNNDFDQMKQLLINLFPNQPFIFKKSHNNYFHPNLSAQIWLNNQPIGFIGQLHPQIFPRRFMFLELQLNLLPTNTPITLKPWLETPLKSRDLTFELKPKTSIGQTIETILNIKDIFNCYVIDHFQDQTKSKVTLRILGSDEAIKTIDQTFN